MNHAIEFTLFSDHYSHHLLYAMSVFKQTFKQGEEQPVSDNLQVIQEKKK